MKDLIARLEKADGADRALDWEIHVANGLEGVGAYAQHPRYTASIDAALTLVPEGMHGHVEFGQSSHSAIIWNGVERIEGLAATSELALCIAALKARSNGSA
jgi:hypothetical protein